MSDPEFSFKMMREVPSESDACATEDPLPSAALADSAEAETCLDSTSNQSDVDDSDVTSGGSCVAEDAVACSLEEDGAASLEGTEEQVKLDLTCIVQDADVAVANSTEFSQAVIDISDVADVVESHAPVLDVKDGEVDFPDQHPSEAGCGVDDNGRAEVEPVARQASLHIEPATTVLVGELGHQEPRKDLHVLRRLSVVQQRRAQHVDKM